MEKDTLDYMIYRCIYDLSDLYMITTEVYEIRAERTYSDENLIILEVYKEQKQLIEAIINQSEKTFEFYVFIEDSDVYYIYRGLTGLLSLVEVF